MTSETVQTGGVLICDDGGTPMDPVLKEVIQQVARDMGLGYVEDKIKACPTCQHFACVCATKANHDVQCKYRTAVTCSIPIECDHGYDVCPTCDPCTCKEKS